MRIKVALILHCNRFCLNMIISLVLHVYICNLLHDLLLALRVVEEKSSLIYECSMRPSSIWIILNWMPCLQFFKILNYFAYPKKAIFISNLFVLSENISEVVWLRELHPCRPLPQLRGVREEWQALPHVLLGRGQGHEDHRGQRIQRCPGQVQHEAAGQDLSRGHKARLVQLGSHSILERRLSHRYCIKFWNFPPHGRPIVMTIIYTCCPSVSTFQNNA